MKKNIPIMQFLNELATDSNALCQKLHKEHPKKELLPAQPDDMDDAIKIEITEKEAIPWSIIIELSGALNHFDDTKLEGDVQYQAVRELMKQTSVFIYCMMRRQALIRQKLDIVLKTKRKSKSTYGGVLTTEDGKYYLYIKEQPKTNKDTPFHLLMYPLGFFHIGMVSMVQNQNVDMGA